MLIAKKKYYNKEQTHQYSKQKILCVSVYLQKKKISKLVNGYI